MTVPDDSALLHINPNYDPAKAREYYLRTRHLKGRQRALQVLQPQSRGAAPLKKVKIAVKAPAQPKMSSKQLREQAHARATQLRGRLAYLNKVLTQLTKEAKDRAVVNGADSTSPAQKQKDAKGKSPQTAKEKRQAHQDYLKNKGKDSQEPQSVKELQAKVAEVQQKIQDARAEIKAANEAKVKRGKSQSQTASKGR